MDEARTEMGEVRRVDPIQGEIIHEYDGIEEADNKLPNWWLVTFYGAIVFAIGYWFYYEEYTIGPHQEEVFASELAERASQGGEADADTLVMLSRDPATVAKGRETFTQNCVACHGDHAQGVIGPNLTDNHWLHGGAPEDIYNTVRHGVQAKGMPAWGPTLGERPVEAVVAYVLTLRNTNVEGRPPQGPVWPPNGEGQEGAEAGGQEPAAVEPAPEAEAPAAHVTTARTEQGT